MNKGSADLGIGRSSMDSGQARKREGDPTYVTVIRRPQLRLHQRKELLYNR